MFVACLSSASRAGATEAKFQGVGDASLGVTDNIQSAPDEPLPGGTTKSAGVYSMLSPSVVLALVSRRTLHRVSYTYTYNLVFGNTSLSTSSNQVFYRSFFDLSPRTSLILGANAIQTNNFSAVILTAPGAGAVNAMPAGTGSFLSATADELMSYDLAPGMRVYEGAAVTEQTPLFDTVAPRTFLVSGRLGAERSWDADAVGVEPRVDYAAITGSLRPDGTPAGEQRQIVGSGVGIWRHDWGQSVTSRLEAGALRVQRLNTGHGFWAPAILATATYVNEVGDAEAGYYHTVTTNPLLGQSLLVDEFRIRGGLPFGKKSEILVGASSGYQRGRLLDEDATLAAHVNVVLFDVGVGWQATESLVLGIRYQHINQSSDVHVMPLPVSFVRNSVMVGASFRYPPDSEMPRAYRAPRRVDRQDEIRDTPGPAAEPRERTNNGTGT